MSKRDYFNSPENECSMYQSQDNKENSSKIFEVKLINNIH